MASCFFQITGLKTKCTESVLKAYNRFTNRILSGQPSWPIWVKTHNCKNMENMFFKHIKYSIKRKKA